MAQYIEKSALVAEIERRRKLVSDPILSGDDLMIGERNALFDLLSFLDTLEAKEVDFDKEYQKWLQEEWFNPKKVRTMSQYCYDMARHFCEFGLQSQNGLTWQDIKDIAEIGNDFMNSEESDDLNEEEYYTEILKRFLGKKGGEA